MDIKCFQKKRYDTSNGATLCKIHHSLFHSIYNKKNFTKDDFDEFINGDSSNISDYDGEILLARKAYCIEDKEIINNILMNFFNFLPFWFFALRFRVLN